MSASPPLVPLGPARPLPSAVRSARSAIQTSLTILLGIPDSALERPWPWRGKDADVRYGFYRLYEALEECAVALGLSFERAGLHPTEAGRILAQATAARWDLHGLLLPLGDANLDLEPGQGEWSLRWTLAHMIAAQKSYSLRSAYAVQRVRLGQADLPVVAPPELIPSFDEEEHLQGTLSELRGKLDDALDLGVRLLDGVERPEELGAPTTWSGYDVTLRFRLHRWSSHLREHTIQVEKILVSLGRFPTEVERLVRLVLAAYGRLEGLTYGLPSGALDRQTAPLPDAPSAGELIIQVPETIRGHVSEIRIAADLV